MASLIASSPSSLPPIPPVLPAAVNTELLLVLAAFFFFLVCVFTGVALAVRNAWLNSSDTRPPPPPLKKKNLDSLPTVNIKPGLKQLDDDHQECPICLAPFAHGDKIRVLPQCSHVFHASCVDTWLVSRSSCPTCRTVIMVVVPSTGTSSVVKEAEHVVSSRSRQCCFSNFLPV